MRNRFALGVLVLVGVEDVRVVLVQELRDRGDDPLAVRAGDEQDGGVLHGWSVHGVVSWQFTGTSVSGR